MADALALVARIEADLAETLARVAELRSLLTPEPKPAPEQWLSTAQLGQRLGRSKSRVATLCRLAQEAGLPGVRKVGPRLWEATPEAMEAIRAGRAR